MKETVRFEIDRDQRRRFWTRVCRMGIVRQRELIRVHLLAQTRRISPEGALVALGILTAEQAATLLNDSTPFGLSMGELGVS